MFLSLKNVNDYQQIITKRTSVKMLFLKTNAHEKSCFFTPVMKFSVKTDKSSGASESIFMVTEYSAFRKVTCLYLITYSCYARNNQ
ncbi:Uncharacterized protein dnm_096050 [Desulfonema magnum]|uniref:Uncharacterized protein n=1 Tax=Desulfonema magnum TaxID=45655 RepID=A0A975BYY9_9BACT|nr:Uncharacterized protein dnm_096050 [Desulfonema magnum]